VRSLDRIVPGSRAVVHDIKAEDSFSRSLLVGICVMFLGFLRAARRRDLAPTN